MEAFQQNRATLLLAAALTLAGGATISAQQPAVVDSAVLRKAGTPVDQFPGSWLTYGKSQSEMRYSPLKQIDASNVKRLGLEWSYVVGAGGYNQEGTPLVWNNTISISVRGVLTRLADLRSTTGRSSPQPSMDGCLRSMRLRANPSGRPAWPIPRTDTT
jgi:quinohemoprotein ethanol dehydrogenase